jgi:putative DNA primase/helicase
MAELSTEQKLAFINAAKKTLSCVDLVRAADVMPKPIRWLWPGWLARGKLAILAGIGGTGKTTVAMSMAAVVSTAGRWPDNLPCREHGNVLIWSSEDDPADTIIPRLTAAGADLKRVHIVRGTFGPDGVPVSFDPATDIAMLHRAVEQIGGASLLIVDPIVSAVAGDMHKANDVRRSLQALVDFAALFDCAVVGISHFSKGSKGSSPADRVIGSQAFGALARLVLVCAKQEDGDTRVLARAKSNIGPDDGGFSYSLEQVALPSNIEASRVIWGGAIDGSAREILGEVETESEQGGDLSGDAASVLRDILQPGEMLSRDAKTQMRAEGFSEKVIRIARERLGVVVRPEGFGKERKTFWSLSNSPYVPSPPINAQQKERANMDIEGAYEAGAEEIEL